MDSSIDDQASQSTTTDQQSETSSVNVQSPSRSVASSSATLQNRFQNLMNVAAAQYSTTHLPASQTVQTTSNYTGTYNQNSGEAPSNNNNIQNQQTFAYPQASSGLRLNHQQNLQHQPLNNRQNAFPLPLPSTPTKRMYTGVDKLIMAAMLDESAAVAAAVAATAGSTNGVGVGNHHLTANGCGYTGPSGRGIGYLGGNNARDNSGSFTHIPIPSNKSELELYRLLDRANLLNYFGTFLNLGGDDVQQLSDADEDEFLEIMILVGMTQKPLHVRRLQKALIEWREADRSF